MKILTSLIVILYLTSCNYPDIDSVPDFKDIKLTKEDVDYYVNDINSQGVDLYEKHFMPLDVIGYTDEEEVLNHVTYLLSDYICAHMVQVIENKRAWEDTIISDKYEAKVDLEGNIILNSNGKEFLV